MGSKWAKGNPPCLEVAQFSISEGSAKGSEPAVCLFNPYPLFCFSLFFLPQGQKVSVWEVNDACPGETNKLECHCPWL